jgi:hypothetical protein
MTRITTILLLLVSMVGTAQQDLMLHGLTNVFQQVYVDPSSAPHRQLHIGLPVMSGISAQHRNTFLNPGRLLQVEEGRQVFQTDRFLSEIENQNIFGFEISTELLSFGLPVKDHYFHFSWRDRVSAYATLPGDLLRFPFVGNGDFDVTGNVLDFTDLALELNHYSEMAFGWQYAMDNGLDIGIRAKLLSGKENATTVDNNMRWVTDTETFAWDIQGNASLQTSGVVTLLDSLDDNSLLENGNFGSYYFGFRNLGLATDIGVGYHFSEKLEARMSVVDLGFISWKDDVRNYDAVGGDLAFIGIEVTEAFIGQDSTFSDSLNVAVDRLVDRLGETIDISESEGSYRTSLRSRMFASVAYRLFDKDKTSAKLSLLMQAQFANGFSIPTMTAMYHQTIGKSIGATVSYSLMDGDWANIGMGLSVKGGPVIFYLTADNLLWSRFTKFKIGEENRFNEYPAFSSNATLRFGMNLALGKQHKPIPRSRLD